MVKVKNKDKIKIGARALSDDQLEKLLPNSKEIYYRIEVIRTHASEHRKSKISYKNTYKKYLAKELDRNSNNVFSILGGRGSGKTSVLLTIKNKLTNIANNDVMLPLVVPENMGDYSDVLGWTICSFEKIIEEIEKYIYKNKNENNIEYDFFKHCRKNENNQLRLKFGELLKYYTWINEDYREILNSTYDGINDYKQKTKDVVNAERELLNKFEEFIEVLINVKKDISEDNDTEPLIYIFFDDVDLSSERCLEIVNIILKYLSMPNIVVFVAGDYATFAETLTINLLAKDGVLKNTNEIFYQRKNTEKKDNTVLEVRKTLAQDILKKVLPPAYRFHMPILSNEYKAEFVYSTQEDEDDKNDKKYDTLVELINRKLMLIEKKDDYKKSFLYYNDALIEIYFNIFDDNPRGLMNIYYFLYGLEKNSINPTEKDAVSEANKHDKEREYCETLKKFLNVILDSNYKLEAIREEINHAINIKTTFNETFIDYEYIKNLYLNEVSSNDKERLNGDSIEKYINMFLIAHFIENLVAYRMKLDRVNRKVHGIDVFIEMINSFNINALIPRYNDSKFVLALYSKIRNKLTTFEKDKLGGYKINYLTKLYIDILYDLMETKNSAKFRNRIFEIIRNDYRWVQDKIDIIFKTTCENEAFLIKAINELDEIGFGSSDKIHISEFWSGFINQINNEFKEIKENYFNISGKNLLMLFNLYQFIIEKKGKTIENRSQYFDYIYVKINEYKDNRESLINEIYKLVGEQNRDDERFKIIRQIDEALDNYDTRFRNLSYYNYNETYENDINQLNQYKYINDDSILLLLDKFDYRRYEVPQMFKRIFYKIYNEVSQRIKRDNITNNMSIQTKTTIGKRERLTLENLSQIEKIIDNSKDITEEDYSIIKNKMYNITRNSRVIYEGQLVEDLDFLYQMTKKFKRKIATDNIKDFELNEFMFFIKKNVLLKACIDIMERDMEKYVYKETYKKLLNMKDELIDSDESMMLKKIISQVEIEMSKIKFEEINNV